MIKHPFILLIIILSLNSFSQVSFDKGYFINNSNLKTECLIKYIDWKNNPSQFEYKLSENTDKTIGNIKTVKEFGIGDKTKYIRSYVKIDRSSEDLDKLSEERNPVFEEEELFLKVLVEGEAANLYFYEEGDLKRYFYNKNNLSTEQLIFKSYKPSDTSIDQNNYFRQQLLNNLKCSNQSVNGIEKIDYQKNDLIAYFVKYNKCNSQEFINFDEKQKKDLFNLSIKTGVNISSLTIENNIVNTRNANFEKEVGARLGVELEFVMPFGRNKWAVAIEPAYQYFKSETTTDTHNVKVDYKSIELSLGLRHFFFLNERSKIFINGAFVYDFRNNSIIDFDSGEDLTMDSDSFIRFGLGYKYNDMISVELKLPITNDILSNYLSWTSNYKTTSLVIGFSFF